MIILIMFLCGLVPLYILGAIACDLAKWLNRPRAKRVRLYKTVSEGNAAIYVFQHNLSVNRRLLWASL